MAADYENRVEESPEISQGRAAVRDTRATGIDLVLGGPGDEGIEIACGGAYEAEFGVPAFRGAIVVLAGQQREVVTAKLEGDDEGGTCAQENERSCQL
jgi:hypothetical protein